MSNKKEEDHNKDESIQNSLDYFPQNLVDSANIDTFSLALARAHAAVGGANYLQFLPVYDKGIYPS